MGDSRIAIAAAAFALIAAAPAAAQSDTAFLDFPAVEGISAAKSAPAFAWLVKQADRSFIVYSKAPEFKRTVLASATDEDGAPITDFLLSPDGTRLVYMTGAPRADETFNPAGLIEAPKTILWLVSTAPGSKPVRLGEGRGPSFSRDGRTLTFTRSGDLWSVDPRIAGAKPKLFAKGGGDWSELVWTKAGDLIFVDDRRGYAFLGRWHPGASKVDWLVTGVDRLAVPVLSPDETKVAFLRLPGREHSRTYDQTESEPFSIGVVDLRTGGTRTVWRTRGPALTLGMDDDEGALRWASDDQLVFYSEDDNWGRLYSLAAAGGTPRAITPTGCMVAESEKSDAGLFVVHNCADRDTRQISLFDPATGTQRPIPQADPVLAGAAAQGDYAAFVAANPNQAALVRILDLKTLRPGLSETYADYDYRSPLTGPGPREVHLTSTDGLEFTGQLFEPSGPGRHPALVYVHGGPQRQMFPSFSYMGYYSNDYAVNRRLAEQGYAVLSINYRSGIGYGRAFRDAPGRAWRDATEYRDVLAAGKWLASQPNVDPNRIGIWGGSYGGLLTGQALARNSDLFKAGVGIHGVYDWSWPSPIKGHLSPSHYFGVDEKDKERALAASPLGHIDTWRSPVLLIHGDSDMNVDVVESVDLAQRLRDRGVDVRTVIFPGEAHDFIRHSAWTTLWKDLDAFFAETLGPPSGQPN
jgi:dipeptidyl aminopeptidase/acylaminoacyl peptidase